MTERQILEAKARAKVELLRRETSRDFLAYARFVMPILQETPFHKSYYRILQDFADGKIKHLIVSVPPQHGKEISDHEIVITPTGKTTHGELKVGDYVFGRNGQPVMVKWVSSKVQSEYIIRFSDGQTIECHGKHEWVVWDVSQRKWRQVETRTLANRKITSGEVGKRGSKFLFKVDENRLVKFPSKDIKLDPYFLGAWLGDGQHLGALLCLCETDSIIAESLPYKIHEVVGSQGVKRFRIEGLIDLMKELNLTRNKHIPDEFIYNSEAVRKEVIAGLIDTDGYVYQKNGRVTISNTNKTIIDQAALILRSLGENVTITKTLASLSSSGVQGKKDVYQLCFNPRSYYPTRVPRKKINRIIKPRKRAIISIEKRQGLNFGNCIEVEGGIYLVGENMIPTHNSLGSSQLLPAYMLGNNPDLKIALASYNATLASRFNKRTQRIMKEPNYKYLFPDTQLKEAAPTRKDANGAIQTSTEFDILNHSGSLITVGREGSLTGNAVDVFILDDLYKDTSEAYSPITRESCSIWYNDVVKSRQHNDTRELIVFTRWHEEDLIGELLQKQNYTILERWDQIDTLSTDEWCVVNFEAIKETPPTEIDPRKEGESLWPERHSLHNLLEKRKLNPHRFECLYQGKPQSAEGLLYNAFDTYTELPATIKKANYTDTADMGDDYLCSICYEVDKEGRIYIVDVLYSRERMEYTEPALAEMLIRNSTREALVESNNGGRGFARAVQPLAPKTNIEWFHQSKNKESRILTNAATVNKFISFPHDWRLRWPELFAHLTTYKRNYKANRWHDAADVLTGICETEVHEEKGLDPRQLLKRLR